MSDYAASFRTHWYARPGWSAGTGRTPYLTCFLLPSDAPDLLSAVAEVHRALSEVRGLDLVPPEWLHLTVQGVAFRADLTDDGLARVVAAVGESVASVPSVRLDLGAKPEVLDEGLAYTATPVEPVAALRTAIRQGAAWALGAAAVPGDPAEPVWPHLSVAYANASLPQAPVHHALRAVPERSLRLGFRTVSLVAMRKEGHRYLWDTVTDLPLAVPSLGGR